MAFIETQRKGGRVYNYLTETLREGKMFRKVRVLLTVNKRPSSARILIGKRKLKEKLAESKSRFNISSSLLKDVPSSLVWERPSKLHLVFIAAEAVVRPQVKEYGAGWGKTHGFFQNGMVKFVWDRRIIIKSGIRIINMLMSEQNFQRKQKRWNGVTARLKRAIKRCSALEKMGDDALIRQQKRFTSTFLSWWGASQIAECISFAGEFLLNEKVDDRTLSLVTTPSSRSYATQEEEELLHLALRVQKDRGLRAYIQRGNKVLSAPGRYGWFKKAIRSHQKSYFWLHNSYDQVNALDDGFFLDEIRKVIGAKTPIESRLKGIESRFNDIIRKRDVALEMLSLPSPHKELIPLLDNFSIFQDKRKAISLEANHYTNAFLLELSRRTGISLNLLYFSTPHEFESILRGRFPTNTLSDRKKECVLLVVDEGIKVLTGVECRDIRQNVLGKQKDTTISEFEGRRAEGGRIVGTARLILDPRKPKSFSQGDILVTTMTSPDFLPLMRKASAIVTDEGGITCHAAIVARELNVPCLVGTGIATSVVKDGMTLEVNANHGIVKIVSRG